MLDKFRFLTAGESHGKCLTAIIEGIPSGFEKKLQKFLLKSLEVMKKSLPLQPLSETKRTF